MMDIIQTHNCFNNNTMEYGTRGSPKCRRSYISTIHHENQTDKMILGLVSALKPPVSILRMCFSCAMGVVNIPRKS